MTKIHMDDGERKSAVGPRLSDLEVGTAFTGTICGSASVYLVTFAGVIDLKDPGATWERDNPSRVLNFKEVDIRIIVE